MKKMKSIIKTSALLLPLVAALSAQAGDKNVIEPKNYLVDEAGFQLDTWYDSAYYFRGLWFSNNNVGTGLTYTKPVTDKLTAAVGALYTVSLGTDVGAADLEYSEMDLFGSLTYDAGFAAFTLAYTNYTFFDTFSGSIGGSTFGDPVNAPDSTVTGASDVSITATVPVFDAGHVYATYVYDLKVAGHYAEAGADYTIPVTPWMSLVPSAQVGYGAGYYTFPELSGVDNGWTHVRVMLAAPIQITPTAAFIPYVAGNLSLDAREKLNVVEGQNDLYGGAKLSIKF
jgi:hypothetical protein